MGFAARTGMLFALLLTELGASRSQNDVVRLLERMSTAAGPVWSAHLVSVSRLTFDGEPAVVETQSEGLRVALRHCTGELCDGTYFDGERLFTVNLNGTTLPESPQTQPYLRSLRLVASLAFLSPSFLAHGGRFGDAGTTTLYGTAYRTIVVGDADSIPMRVFVDPNTGLVRYAREFGGSDTFEFRDYRRVGAFTLPFEVMHDGQLFERYDNRAAVSSAFHPPHGLEPSLQGAPAAIPTDAKAIEPIVDCSVGGIAVRCMIDTGNSGLSMSSELASRLGAPVVGTYQVRGLGGYTTQVVRAGPLRVGNAAYSNAYYVVLSDLRRYGYDVVLGADIFGTSAVEMDLGSHLVTLGAPLTAHAIDVPISFQHSVPVVRVGLGNLDVDLAVDTGDESNVNLAYDFYAKHPGLFTVTSRRFVSGIGGSSVELIGEIGDVTIGGYRAGPQHIGTTWTLHGTASGHLGAGFWQQFVVGFDYANGEIHLIPRKT
ncbi:MAG TPA: retropepsin-like aspartic protease [Candidatus Cybelea sp.]|nr:retropepsin-like aspartic protease [Candidatus Cybelea sp.]